MGRGAGAGAAPVPAPAALQEGRGVKLTSHTHESNNINQPTESQTAVRSNLDEFPNPTMGLSSQSLHLSCQSIDPSDHVGPIVHSV
jgi:hypothetical protein